MVMKADDIDYRALLISNFADDLKGWMKDHKEAGHAVTVDYDWAIHELTTLETELVLLAQKMKEDEDGHEQHKEQSGESR